MGRSTDLTLSNVLSTGDLLSNISGHEVWRQHNQCAEGTVYFETRGMDLNLLQAQTEISLT